MKINLTTRVVTKIDLDLTFPIYAKSTTVHDHQPVSFRHYHRIDADGSLFKLDIVHDPGEIEYAFSVEKIDIVRDVEDYLPTIGGINVLQCDKQEFEDAVSEASAALHEIMMK